MFFRRRGDGLAFLKNFRQPQISLRTWLMAFTLIAVCFAAQKSTHYRWHGALLAIVCIAISVGLIQQSRDIRRALEKWDEKSLSYRRAWQIACWWRVIVAGLLVLWLGVDFLESFDVLDLPTIESSNVPPVGIFFWDMSRPMLIIVSLSAGIAANQYRERKKTTLSHIGNWLGNIVALSLPFVMLMLIGCVESLVHIAIRGLVMRYPTRFMGKPFLESDVYVYVRLSQWAYFASFLSLALSIAGSACIAMLLGGSWRRRTSFGLWFGWVVCTTTNLSFAYWMHVRGIRILSPLLYEATPSIGSPSVLFTWLTSGLPFAALAAWTLHCRRSSSTLNPLPWYSRETGYVHEHRFCSFLLLTALLGARYPFEIMDLEELTLDPRGAGALTLAMMWLALEGIFSKRSLERIRAMELLAPVSLAHLAWSFVAILLTLIALVESVRWSNFMFWIGY